MRACVERKRDGEIGNNNSERLNGRGMGGAEDRFYRIRVLIRDVCREIRRDEKCIKKYHQYPARNWKGFI